MKKSINVYFNNQHNLKTIIDAIKEAGFDEFYTGIYNVEPNMNLRQVCEYAKSKGLNCTMIHCSYNEPNLHYFWENGKMGDELCQQFCDQIIASRGLTKDFVVHLNGCKGQTQSPIGLDRINRMLKVCDECDINLCIENLYIEQEIRYIFSHLKHPKLKICFDTGHKNFLTPNFDIVKEYGKYITTLHLHDNDGKTDQHKICGQGNIDWQNFAKSISNYQYLVLSAEIKDDEQEITKTLQECKQNLDRLDNMIKSFSIQNQR